MEIDATKKILLRNLLVTDITEVKQYQYFMINEIIFIFFLPKVLDSRWSEALKTLDLVLLLQQPAKDKAIPIVSGKVEKCKRVIACQ